VPVSISDAPAAGVSAVGPLEMQVNFIPPPSLRPIQFDPAEPAVRLYTGYPTGSNAVSYILPKLTDPTGNEIFISTGFLQNLAVDIPKASVLNRGLLGYLHYIRRLNTYDFFRIKTVSGDRYRFIFFSFPAQHGDDELMRMFIDTLRALTAAYKEPRVFDVVLDVLRDYPDDVLVATVESLRSYHHFHIYRQGSASPVIPPSTVSVTSTGSVSSRVRFLRPIPNYDASIEYNVSFIPEICSGPR